MKLLRSLCLVVECCIGVAACGNETAQSTQSSASSHAESEQPNIIFIMADDLGYGHLGSYGQKVLETPAIDRLASNGMRFTQAYAGSTVCAPSRSVLMTGQHTGHTTVRGNWGPNGERIPLKDEDITIAEVLKSAGYRTGMIGKWGLGEPGTTGLPNRQGFDHWFGFLNQHNAHSFYPPFLWRNDRIVYYNENENGQRRTYVQDLFIEETLDFIRNEKNSPFFLYLPLTLPHTELAARPGLAKKYSGKFDDLPWPAEKGRPEVAEAKAEYAGMIATMDHDIGLIMAELDKQGIADRTIVIFTSDNGAATEHGAVAEYFDGSGPLRGIKRDMYEGGIRVPLIVNWPSRIAAGTVETLSHVSFQDFLPTFAEIGGGVAPTGIDGISILPALVEEETVGNDRPLYWEFRQKPHLPLKQAVREGKWKAVRLREDQPIELYDLSVDLSESNDIAADHPELVDRFEEIMTTSRN